jgi:hypothetical protein
MLKILADDKHPSLFWAKVLQELPARVRKLDGPFIICTSGLGSDFPFKVGGGGGGGGVGNILVKIFDSKVEAKKEGSNHR